jgi:hypothetical protein
LGSKEIPAFAGIAMWNWNHIINDVSIYSYFVFMYLGDYNYGFCLGLVLEFVGK